MKHDESTRHVSIAEVKNILKKMSKDREELSYGQRIALEHAEKFSQLPLKKTHELIKELMTLKSLEEDHAYKIADILPRTEDDVKAVFAKERITPSDDEIKTILQIVNKHYIV